MLPPPNTTLSYLKGHEKSNPEGGPAYVFTCIHNKKPLTKYLPILREKKNTWGRQGGSKEVILSCTIHKSLSN